MREIKILNIELVYLILNFKLFLNIYYIINWNINIRNTTIGNKGIKSFSESLENMK